MDETEKTWFDHKIKGNFKSLCLLARTLDNSPGPSLAFENYRDFAIDVRCSARHSIISIIHSVKLPNDQYLNGRIDINAIPVPAGGQWLRVTSRDTDLALAERVWMLLRAELIGKGFMDAQQEESKGALPPKVSRTSDGPGEKVQKRFQVFDRLSRQHPEWTQATIARKSIKELGEENINENTVRNTYRAMGRSGSEEIVAGKE